MPLYEYQCPKCGRFEVIQKFSDAPLAACPTCGGEVQKMLSAPAFQFKGTGWYITDYARKGGEGKGKGESKTDGGGDASGQGAAQDGAASGAKEAGSSSAAGSSGSKGSTGSSGSST